MCWHLDRIRYAVYWICVRSIHKYSLRLAAAFDLRGSRISGIQGPFRRAKQILVSDTGTEANSHSACLLNLAEPEESIGSIRWFVGYLRRYLMSSGYGEGDGEGDGEMQCLLSPMMYRHLCCHHRILLEHISRYTSY